MSKKVVHPLCVTTVTADRMGFLKLEMERMQSEYDALAAGVVQHGSTVEGFAFNACYVNGYSYFMPDGKAIAEEMGEAWLLKRSKTVTVSAKVNVKPRADAAAKAA